MNEKFLTKLNELTDGQVLLAVTHLKPALLGIMAPQNNEVDSSLTDVSIASMYLDLAKTSELAKTIYDDISMQESSSELITCARTTLLVAYQWDALDDEVVKRAVETARLEFRSVEPLTIIGVAGVLYLLSRCIPTEIQRKVTSEIEGDRTQTSTELLIRFPSADLTAFGSLLKSIKSLVVGS